tara:strand:- start:4417 stop:5592 length:1176 start_codon:yes stop_codon:yes gene_type:complete
MSEYLFTSESVSEGHPDKVSDQISDAILDAILTHDSDARVACETLCSTGLVIISGEISTHASVDYNKIARETIKRIGYTSSEIGFDAHTCSVLTAFNKQSCDIAQGVDRNKGQELDQGAGDQGLMFGYACNETAQLMPMPIHYAHRLVERQAEIRKSGQLPWLRPDAKSQVSVNYRDGSPENIETIVISTQHDPEISHADLTEAVVEEIIKPVLLEEIRNSNIRYLVNPTGRFVIGGPMGDCGLTGRKIVVDTYGGAAHHGGGAFSGKDPSKVDRSAAYAGRYVAKNIVAAGIASRCEVQIAYAIGVASPVSLMVNTFGTGKIPDDKIVQLIERNFDLRPRAIIQSLNLLRPIYLKTASYGHFGRDDQGFTWEVTDKIEQLKVDAGIKNYV